MSTVVHHKLLMVFSSLKKGHFNLLKVETSIMPQLDLKHINIIASCKVVMLGHVKKTQNFRYLEVCTLISTANWKETKWFQ
jgi:hypothetical protein